MNEDTSNPHSPDSSQRVTAFIAPAPPPQSRKWIVWLFIVCTSTVILFAGGYYVFSAQKAKPVQYPKSITEKMNQPTPTPDPTENWKVYTNNLLKYQVKYPSDWQVVDDPEIKEVNFFSPLVDINDLQPDSPQLGISYKKEPFYMQMASNWSEGDVPFVSHWKRITVSGVTGNSYSTHQCAPQCTDVVNLPYKKGYETISIYVTTRGDHEVFKNMVDSFKFLEPQEEYTTVWNEYKNEDYAFEFKYPKELEYSELNPRSLRLQKNLYDYVNDKPIVEINGPPREIDTKFPYEFQITFFEGSTLDFNNQIEDYKHTATEWSKFKEEKITINSVEATKLWNVGYSVPEIVVFFHKNNTIYIVSIVYSDFAYDTQNFNDIEKHIRFSSKSSEAIAMFDNILSTLKFAQ